MQDEQLIDVEHAHARRLPDRQAVERALAEARVENNRLRGMAAVRDRKLEAVLAQVTTLADKGAEAQESIGELEARLARSSEELLRAQQALDGLLPGGRQLAELLAAERRPIVSDTTVVSSPAASTTNGATPGDGCSPLGHAEGGVVLLSLTLDRARNALAAGTEDRRSLNHRLQELTSAARHAANRQRELEEVVARLEADLAGARLETERHLETVAALTNERKRFAEQAQLVAESRSWRLGHGTALLLKKLTFRPTKQAGAIDVLRDLLESPPLLESGAEEVRPQP